VRKSVKTEIIKRDFVEKEQLIQENIKLKENNKTNTQIINQLLKQ
jgi:hypothetical protein